MNYIGVFLVLFLLRNIIIHHIKISHLQFLSDLDLTAWTQLAEVKDCWMLSLAWQTWTTVPGERIIIVMEQCEDTAILFTRPVVQVVGHLGREVEVLTALSLGGGGEDHVPDSPLVPLVQALVDLVHTPEGDGGHLLPGHSLTHSVPIYLLIGCRSVTKTGNEMNRYRSLLCLTSLIIHCQFD